MPNLDKRSILENLITNIAQNYFNLDDMDMNRVSNFGYISESMAESIDDTVNINVTRAQNYIPELATNETIVKETAKLRNIPVVLAEPSEALCIISISKEDILQRGISDSNGMVTFIIDKRSYIVNNNIYYAMLSDVIIRAIPTVTAGVYIYSAAYVSDFDSYILAYDDFLEDSPVLNLLVTALQMRYNIQEQIVIDQVEFLYSGLVYEYDDNLAGFDIYYKTGNNTEYVHVDAKYYLNPNTDDTSESIFYNDDRNNILRVLNNPLLNLPTNTTIRVEIKETLGETDSLAIGITETSFELYKDAGYNYAGIGIYADILEIVTTGKDADTLDELKHRMIRQKIYRDNVTTDIDIINYVDDINANVEIVKKRIDLEDRLYTIYTLLRDDGFILPATTRNLLVGETEFDYIDPVTNTKYLNSDNKFLVGLDKIARKTDKDSTDPRCVSIPFITIFDEYNIPYFYFQTVNESFILSPQTNNVNNPFQAISRNIKIFRDQFDSTKTYHLTTTMSLNTSNDKEFVDDDGNIIDMDSLKAFVLFKNDDENVAYSIMDLVSYEPDTRVFTLESSFQTDDLVTDDKKLHITDGLKEISTVDNFTGLIDFSDAVFEVYYMIKELSTIVSDVFDPIVNHNIHLLVPGYDDFDYMNSFNNENKRANLLIEMNGICRSGVGTYKNGATEYDVETRVIQVASNTSTLKLESYDPTRDYIILALDGNVLLNGIDYIIESDGTFNFGSRVILPKNNISYMIYKNYDDVTLRYYERSDYTIQDDNYKIPLDGYTDSGDMVRIYSNKYGYLDNSDYTIELGKAVLNIPDVKNGDEFEVQIFKNNSYIDTNITLIKDDTYKIYNANLYELIISEEIYVQEMDFLDIVLADGTVLTKNIDYFIMYDSRILISDTIISEGDSITLKTIKDAKGPRDIRIGNISPPDDLVVVPGYEKVTDEVELFYKGVLLQENIDYIINDDNSIRLLTFTVDSRKEIMYRLYKNIKLISYEIEKEFVRIHGTYISDRYSLEIITIPGFNSTENSIQLYKDGALLINPDDYSIMDDGNIYLEESISLGESIDYYITKVYDVTNKMKVTDLVYINNTGSPVQTIDLSSDPQFYANFNYIEIAAYQTLLRPGVDYNIDGNNLVLITPVMENGDKFNIRLYDVENNEGDIVQIINEQYIATQDNPEYLPLINYDEDTDILLNVNYNQTSLIRDRDYTHDMNKVNIKRYEYSGLETSTIAIKDFDPNNDFIKVYKNNKILYPSQYDRLNDFIVLMEPSTSSDTFIVEIYMNMKLGDVVNYYTKDIIITQDNQRYIYDSDINLLEEIYYNGNTLRYNIDYITNDGTIVLYNQNVRVGDVLTFVRSRIVDPGYLTSFTFFTVTSGSPISIPSYIYSDDYLVVNLEGRILFEDIDYIISGNNLILRDVIVLDGTVLHYTIYKGFKVKYNDRVNGIVINSKLKINAGDIFQFTIIKPVRKDIEIITTEHVSSVNNYYGEIPVTNFNPETDYLMVNYNQTLLTEGTNYITNDEGSISFINTPLNIGDTLYFIILKDIRKIMDVLTGYVSGPENLILIPDLDRRYDALVLVVDGKLLLDIVDFNIDENNKVIFNTLTVSPDSIVHYKIFKYYLGNELGAYTTELIEVPFIQYDYMINNLIVVYDNILNLYATYSALVSQVTGVDINLKFTSTFGDSDYIYIMDEELNNLNPVLRFRLYGSDIDSSEVKDFIIQYFRDTYIEDNVIFISNICRLIEIEFEEVKGITYLGTDDFGSLYQKISYKKPDLKTVGGIGYIPECLNINEIKIELEEIL